MEALSPASAYLMNSNRMNGGCGGDGGCNKWTQQENKMFENALAHIDSNTPDRWARIAAMLPGKTVRDVVSHYQYLEDDVNHIEAGLFPFPAYSSAPSWESRKRSVAAKLSDQERKKGVPWTEQEHKLFLLGLKKYGKGDWRNISRNFVVTRTPTQVASHAQKYYIRLNSGGKDKRRASIHDITTQNLTDNPEMASGYSPLEDGNRFVHLPYGMKLKADKLDGGSLHDSML